MNDLKNSILNMARGSIMERFEYEVSKVVDNIQDINTEPEKKRTVTLTVDFEPDTERQIIKISAHAKSKLQPVVNANTSVVITADENGERILQEYGKKTPIPGQIDMDGKEQETPKIMKLQAMN